MEENQLVLIPKIEKHLEYAINLILKIPRTEKFSIGTEYKNSIYETLKTAIYILKIDESRRLYYIDKIDAELNFQRVLLRVMLHNRWIDEKKFKVAMDMIYEIGKLIGGLIKYYAKKYKK